MSRCTCKSCTFHRGRAPFWNSIAILLLVAVCVAGAMGWLG